MSTEYWLGPCQMRITPSNSLIVCMKIVLCLTDNMSERLVRVTCLTSMQKKLNITAVARTETKTSGAI